MENKKINSVIGFFNTLIFAIISIILININYENRKIYLIINILFSIMLITFGILQKKFPPMFIKPQFINIKLGGYITRRARIDSEHWYKAQELSGKHSIKMGIVCLLFDLILIILSFFYWNELKNINIIIFKVIIWGILMFIYVETNLKRIFKDDDFLKI